MKKIAGIMILAGIVLLTACKGNDNKDAKTPGNDVIIPPPDANSAATNPSSADTAFARDTSYLKIDSSRQQ